MIDWDKVRYFTREEFGESLGMSPDPELVGKLDEARHLASKWAGRPVPFIITSGIRPHDTTVVGLQSAHVTGQAVDLRAWTSRDRFYILKALFAVGFSRIGIYDKHIHADVSRIHDRDVVWTGESR